MKQNQFTIALQTYLEKVPKKEKKQKVKFDKN